MVIKDGTRVSEKPGETFGTNQSPETVSALLEKNFLPTDKFVNGFSPVLINTGSDVILFDTGMGEQGRANGMGRLSEGMMAAGYSPEDVTIVVLTHMHGDHIGGLMERANRPLPRRAISPGSANMISGPIPPGLEHQPKVHKKRFWPM